MKQGFRGLMTGMALGAVMLAASLSAQGPTKVELKDGQGKPVGTATLTAAGGMVHIQLDVKGLKPGEHAIHIHGTAKCEGPAFTSAGRTPAWPSRSAWQRAAATRSCAPRGDRPSSKSAGWRVWRTSACT